MLLVWFAHRQQRLQMRRPHQHSRSRHRWRHLMWPLRLIFAQPSHSLIPPHQIRPQRVSMTRKFLHLVVFRLYLQQRYLL
jgi:hypothetical protein